MIISAQINALPFFPRFEVEQNLPCGCGCGTSVVNSTSHDLHVDCRKAAGNTPDTELNSILHRAQISQETAQTLNLGLHLR